MNGYNQGWKGQKRSKTPLYCENDTAEGESIERKVEKMFAGNETVDLVRSPIYQQRREGINPAYDIRTDRHEQLREAVEKSTEKYYEARQLRMDEAKAKEEAKKVSDGAESTRTGADAGQNQ